MNKEFITLEIKNLMEVINEQQLLLLSNRDKIPQIEIDILMGNISRLYERLMDLKKVNFTVPAPEAVPTPTGTDNKPEELIAKKVAIPEVEKTESREDSQSEKSNEINMLAVSESAQDNGEAHMQQATTIASINNPETAPVEEIQEEVGFTQERTREFVKPVNKVPVTASLFDEVPAPSSPSTVSDKFQNTTTLYDKIASTKKEDKSLAGKLQKNPVSDLKKSIGINEKFAFINELFDGNLNNYNAAIEQLNKSDDLPQAMDFLSKALSSNPNINEEGSSYQHLKNLLERRFSA